MADSEEIQPLVCDNGTGMVKRFCQMHLRRLLHLMLHLSVAFMEALSVVFQTVSDIQNSEDASGFLISLLFILGPLLGGVALVAFALAFHLQHALLTGIASGVAFVLGAWRPTQLLLSSKMDFLSLISLLVVGFLFLHVSCYLSV